MNKRIAAWVLTATMVLGTAAAAQGVSWVQIASTATLRGAEDSLRDYAGRLEDVNGFRASTGWYAIALGPYSAEDAQNKLRELRASGAIPDDAFVSEGAIFEQQFWPVGANALAAAPVAPVTEEAGPAVAEVAVVQPAPVVDPAPEPEPEETVAQARRSERGLDRAAREALQVALQWEGFYTSGIDGAFGPGTRRAMADWQEAMGLEATGVLTTRQRVQLLDRYQAVLDSLSMRTVIDNAAGIEMAMPSAMVKYSRYEAPFAHYDAIDGSGVRVLLISQTGDRNTLFGLYDILQSLEIVPMEGPRERNRNSFTIEGTDGGIESYTYAELVDGAVKGYTLIWPTGDDQRRNMALKEMQASFASLGETALADNAGLDDAIQSLDLLSGLKIRRPDLSRSGFYVSANGMVLTTTEVTGSCQRLTLDNSYEAELVASNADLGVALLKPAQALAPVGSAQFLTTDARLKSEIAVAGYSFEGRLGAPTLTFGTLADLTGLGGEAELTRLALSAQPGDAGGPVFDGGGAVIGMLLPKANGGARQLPGDVSFAVDGTVLAAFLEENGVAAATTEASTSMDPVDMGAMASGVTVLVSCWN